MTRHPLHLLVVAAAIACATPAHATSPEKTCLAKWWVPSPWIPTELTHLPSDGAIALPLASTDWYLDFPELGPSALVVEVRDDANQPVEGVVGAGFEEAFLSSAYTHFEARLPPWWRPTAPLAPGNYSVRVVVNDPPTTDAFKDCDYQGFERTMSFTVSSLPALEPDIKLTLIDTAVPSDNILYTRITSSIPLIRPALCPNEPSIHCGYGYNAEWHTFSVQRTMTGIPGGPLYAIIETERDTIDQGFYLKSTYDAEYPLKPMALTTPWSHNVGDPNVTDSLCAHARLWSLHELKVVVEKTECIPIGVAAPLSSLPDPVCDPVECTRMREAVEAGTEPDGADQGCSTQASARSMLAFLLLLGALSRPGRARLARVLALAPRRPSR